MYNWYSKLFAFVKWNDDLSSSFSVGSGVRQGLALSPAIFNVFMNLFISNLKKHLGTVVALTIIILIDSYKLMT